MGHRGSLYYRTHHTDITGGLIFVGDTPAFLADPIVLRRLCKNIPYGGRAKRIIEEGCKQNVPFSLGFAVYAMETSFRPWWVRVFETTYLFAVIFRWLFTGMGFRNVTIGVFQIGCHIVGDYICAEYKRKASFWHPKKSLRLTRVLLGLPFFGFNVKVAMFRIGKLWREAIGLGLGFEDAVIYVGAWYNGNEGYGQALLRIIHAISS